MGIENTADPRSSMVMISLKPEPIPLDLKVLLLEMKTFIKSLLAMDYDFRKLFKIKVEFEDDAPITAENMNKLARFIAGYCTKRNYLLLLKKLLQKL